MEYIHERFRYGVILAMGFVMIPANISRGVTQQEIEKIRSLTVLTDQHLESLKEYIAEQFRLILRANEPSEASILTGDLLDISKGKMTEESTAKLYSGCFAAAVKQSYPEIYNKGRQLSANPDAKQGQLGNQLRLSAAVLLASSDNTVVIEDMISLLDDDLTEVRYWAAKGLTGKNIKSDMAKSDTAAAMINKVLDGLRRCLGKEEQGSVIAQIAAAADLPDQAAGGAIMQACAAKRLEQYRKWSVHNEWVDQEIILLMVDAAGSEKARQDEELRRGLIRGSANLYGAAYERYSKGMLYKGPDGSEVVLLSVESQEALSTLLIEGEIVFIRIVNQITGSGRTGRFLPAMQGTNWKKMEAAYLALMGTDGAVNRAFDIYGSGGPLTLPEPPKDVVERAKTLAEVASKAVGRDIKPPK